uniref:Lipocalin/cytosolic fatty-acid binding domain-containing protein n=1 Tax=Phlebotomus papatasi TaxID=29031 RepID=A0A1B0EX80_PHLPP
FLGVWYVIQKTSTASTCVVYNITRGEEPGEYQIEQTSQHFALGLTPLKHEYSYTGILSVPDADTPAKMKVRFPLSVAGSSKFLVFMTDYHQYAGIFSCQKVAFAHRRSATILSRTKTLDKIYLDKIRARLSNYNVDPYDLSIVSQNDCPKNGSEGFNIHIDPNTFSAANIASVVRSAGDKIASGVETAINAGKKVGTAYNKLTTSKEDSDKTSTESTETMNYRTSGRMQHDPNAEWIAF